METDRDVTMGDVYQEFDKLRKSLNIREFGSCSVSRQYAFELSGIPQESEYLKVVYPFAGKEPLFLFLIVLEPALPAKLKGNSFSHVFGANTSALELFLLKRKLMGPCWIEIKGARILKPTVCQLKTHIRFRYLGVKLKLLLRIRKTFGLSRKEMNQHLKSHPLYV